MKNIVLVITSAIIGVLTLAIVMTVGGREVRSMEINSNLPAAVEQTVANLAESKYTIADRNEYLADFMEDLTAGLDTDSDIKVEITNVDLERKMMGVKVTETFDHPNGRQGSVTCERTVILDPSEGVEDSEYKVRFYINGHLYKACMVMAGETVNEPVKPDGISGWQDESGYLADFSQPVTQDLIYYAY